LLKSIARTEEEGRTADDDPTVDLADKAANSYTKEFLFGQTNTDRSMLALIDEALRRIKDNKFGTCVQCEEELQLKRLEAVPGRGTASPARKNTNKACCRKRFASAAPFLAGRQASRIPRPGPGQ